MVTGIKTVESALGKGDKEPAVSESENRSVVRRSLAAAIEIPAGTVLDKKMVAVLRPSTGIPPTDLEKAIGRTVKRSLRAGERITWEELE